MSDLGSIVGKNGDSVNLNLLPISKLKEMLKDTNQQKKEEIDAINSTFGEKRDSSQEITQISFTEEEMLIGESVINGRVEMGSVPNVVRGIERFKSTVMDEIGKRFNSDKERTSTEELKKIDEVQVEEDREM